VIERAGRAGKHLRARCQDLVPVSTDGYPTPARRPLDSRLDTSKFRRSFDLTLPDWQLGVQRMLDDILG
jgi:dTDP-4-dehydrorhamnose reductase